MEGFIRDCLRGNYLWGSVIGEKERKGVGIHSIAFSEPLIWYNYLFSGAEAGNIIMLWNYEFPAIDYIFCKYNIKTGSIRNVFYH